jgi:hypothetical protein
MKKLAAVLCAIALMLTMVAPAMANQSISDLSEDVIEVTPETEIPEGASVEVLPADVNRYENEAVKEAVAGVNGEETVSTVEEVVTALNAELPEGVEAMDYDFITAFADVVLVEGSEVTFDDNGNVVQASVKLAVDVLKDVAPEDLDDYMIMLINPATGEVRFIKLDPESFNQETGEITVDFPFLGTFALIQKV